MLVSKFIKALSISCLTIASCSISSIAQAVNPNFIQLTYLASQIQCGAAGELINVEVDVYNNDEFVQTLSVDDTIYLPINSFEDLDFQYNVADSGCSPIATPEEEIFAPDDTLPTLPGAYEQASLQDMLDDLNEYEELFVVELGTTDPTNPVYDLQDVVMVINNNVYVD
ncbi:MAG: hypothetical protein AAGA80_15565 [Cyanobacteria bacterium P01_F01_bin.143]